MDFSIGDIEEVKVAAVKADSTGPSYVTEIGAYVGTIKGVTLVEFPPQKGYELGSKAFSIEAKVESDSGEYKILKVGIFVSTKEGLTTYVDKKGNKLPLMGFNQIRGGLLTILKIKDLAAVKNEDIGNTFPKIHATYPLLEGRKIGFLVDIRLSNGKGKNANKVYKNPQIVAFYDPDTNQTGSEILSGKSDAKKKAKIESRLKVIDDTVKQATDAVQGSDPFTNSDAKDDPFAESNNDDPFKESNEASNDAFNDASNDEEGETDTETSVDEGDSTQSE